MFLNWDKPPEQIDSNVLHRLDALLDKILKEKHAAPEIEDEYPFEQPKTPSWYEQSRKLLCLYDNQISLDTWHNRYHCWIGENAHTKQTVVLICWQQWQDNLEEILAYAKNKPLDAFIILEEDSEIPAGHEVTCFTKEELLEKLIDFDTHFSQYYRQIKKAIQVEQFAQLALTLDDMYVQSDYKLEKEAVDRQHHIEQFIDEWLDESSWRQLAILGEYGHGKSTLAQMLTYKLLRRYQADKKTRIPILIILRGNYPKTPRELLNDWKDNAKCTIDTDILMQLLIAGRLLIILEGLDEINVTGGENILKDHINKLWQFAGYKNAKTIFTVRPNFFFDKEKLRQALQIKKISTVNPYCQALYLESFSLEQIQQSLRQVDAEKRKAIINLAKKNDRFEEIAARPSALIMIATVWQELPIDRINSARVMKVYVEQVEDRQVKKEIQTAKQEGREFTQLSRAERAYFMEAIAVYMAVNHLPNQISKEALNTVIQRMIDKIPDAVSDALSPIERIKKREPLRQRLLGSDNKKEREEAVKSIQTDVRSCGLLVTDLTKDNTFKFAHKSFMEFLAAKVFADWKVRKESNNKIVESIVNAFKLKKRHIFRQSEIREFFGEMLANHFKEADKLKLSKKLFQSLTRFPLFFHKILLLMSAKMWQLFKHDILKSDTFMFNFLGAFAGTIIVAIIVAFPEAGAFAVAGAGAVAEAVAIAIAIAIAITFVGAEVQQVAIAVVVVVVVVVTFAVGGAGAVVLKELGYLYGISIFLMIFIPNFLFGASLGLLEGKKRKHLQSLWVKYELWYQTCRSLDIDHDTMAKVVGKSAMVLFEED